MHTSKKFRFDDAPATLLFMCPVHGTVGHIGHNYLTVTSDNSAAGSLLIYSPLSCCANSSPRSDIIFRQGAEHVLVDVVIYSGVLDTPIALLDTITERNINGLRYGIQDIPTPIL